MDQMRNQEFLDRNSFRSFCKLIITNAFMRCMLVNDEKILPMLAENDAVCHLS